MAQSQAHIITFTLADGIGIRIEKVADVIITILTERSFQFEVVNPLHILHEILLTDEPCSTKRVEVTPTVIGMETR